MYVLSSIPNKVAGYAVGGGHVLHMVCDLTIVADNAIFGQTGAKVLIYGAKVLIYLSYLILLVFINLELLTSLLAAHRLSKLHVFFSFIISCCKIEGCKGC